MTTEKQRDANRRNAQKSTGPQTPEGKQTVSQNAVTHGLTATGPVIFAEDQQRFNTFAQRIRDHYQAEGAAEDLAVERIVECAWRLQRVGRIEAGIFAASVLKKISVEEAPEDRTAAIGTAYSRNAGAFARLSRHERQIERSYYNAVQQLEKLQYARIMQCDPFYVGNMGKFTAMSDSSPKKEEGSHRSGTRQS